jgi:hypothetical protein
MASSPSWWIRAERVDRFGNMGHDFVVQEFEMLLHEHTAMVFLKEIYRRGHLSRLAIMGCLQYQVSEIA